MRQKPLDKRLQSERRRQVRKEKSKEAARCRRGKEGEVFSDIIDTLPVNDNVKGTLDKTSIIRLCINFIKTRNLLGNVSIQDANEPCEDFEPSIEEAINALHGFVLILSASGEAVYVTSNIKKLLGICEYDVIGHSLDTFVHPADWDQVRQEVTKSRNTTLDFTARFKSNLATRSRGANNKSASYKTLKFSGKRLQKDVKPKDGDVAECIVLTATPIEHPATVKQPLDSMTFTSKHSLDMKFTECDLHVKKLTSYPEKYILGKSFYDFIHPSDIKAIVANFKALSNKEHIITDPYMFLTCGGGYVKVITQASVITDSKTNKPQHVLSVHRVISEQVGPGIIMANIQMVEGFVPVKMERVLNDFCDDHIKPTPCVTSAGETVAQGGTGSNTEAHAFDDIFDATAGVFMDPEKETHDLDIMGVTESIFGDPTPADGIPDDEFGHIGGKSVTDGSNKSGKTALEQLVEELDKDTIDMNRGLFVDLPEMDDKDFYLRAPYIPMEDFSDMPIIDSWCYEETSPVANKHEDWTTYRQGEVKSSPSSVPSPAAYSPAKSELSPAVTNSPWQNDSDSGDLASDLAQLSYTHNDHDSYSKSVETTLSSLADINDCFNDRLTVTTAEVQQPACLTKQTWSNDDYALYNNIPRTDISQVPTNATHTQDTYGYTRRKRKASNHYGLTAQSPLKSVNTLSPNMAADVMYKTTSPTVVQSKERGPYVSQANGQSHHQGGYQRMTGLSETKFDSARWDDWETPRKRLNSGQPQAIPVGSNISKPLLMDRVKAVDLYNASWLQTNGHSNQLLKYKPTIEKGLAIARDRDKRTVVKMDRGDSLLLGLLQQT